MPIESMLTCLARGADGVLLMCRDQATCPYGAGGALAERRIMAAEVLADEAGFGGNRIQYIRPEPGPGGPPAALEAFKAMASPTRVTTPLTWEETRQAGMDRAVEIKDWAARQPGLRPARKINKRTVTQMVSLVFLHSSFWDWAQFKWFCNPVLSCHSCPLAWFACPIGVFVHYSGYQVFPFLALGTVLLLGVFFARLLCGWVCPFGFLQDLLYKIPTLKITLPAWTANIKYAVLVLGVFLLPFLFGEQTVFSFCRICPAAAMQSTIPNLIDTGASWLQTLVMVKIGFLVLFLVLSTLSNRAFCKVVCPIGALLAPLNLISFWKIKKPTENCINCSLCNKSCPPGGTPSSRVSEGLSASRTMDCVLCYECKTSCPFAKAKSGRIQEGVPS
ncbi:MAG: 4Fe-4S binding protein [Planctomycetes bacterium]|nr:4Fe-4S binding protein [Planctomycetota bacterium]